MEISICATAFRSDFGFRVVILFFFSLYDFFLFFDFDVFYSCLTVEACTNQMQNSFLDLAIHHYEVQYVEIITVASSGRLLSSETADLATSYDVLAANYYHCNR